VRWRARARPLPGPDAADHQGRVSKRRSPTRRSACRSPADTQLTDSKSTNVGFLSAPRRADTRCRTSKNELSDYLLQRGGHASTSEPARGRAPPGPLTRDRARHPHGAGLLLDRPIGQGPSSRHRGTSAAEGVLRARDAEFGERAGAGIGADAALYKHDSRARSSSRSKTVCEPAIGPAAVIEPTGG